jgi:acyl dehydratase
LRKASLARSGYLYVLTKRRATFNPNATHAGMTRFQQNCPGIAVMSASVYDELKAMIGQDQPEMVATDEVCKQMIRHWCEAIQDANPLYTDEEYARKSRYGSIIAPPAMVQAWVIPPLWPPKEMPAVYRGVFEACARGGFDQVIDTDCEMEFVRPLFPGDRARAVTGVCGVTMEKDTRLGRGHFVTLESTYSNQRGEPVCVQRVTLLVYGTGARRNALDDTRPSVEQGEETTEPCVASGDPGLVAGHVRGGVEYASRRWDEVKEGEHLPALTSEVTATTVIAAAIASRDFYPVHHDRLFAQRAGARDIFTNIITSGGFVQRYLTGWSGPEGELARLKFRLGVPCYAGDTLSMTGKVARKYVKGGQCLLDLEYGFVVPHGSHCTGTATMVLPAR